MNTSIKARLGIMMFLQFFIWGAWFVTLGTYLGTIGFSGSQVGYSYLMNNIAAIISPFFIGIVADRFFSSQKVMGVLHIAGAIVLYYASGITVAGPLITFLLVYNICYMPTLALVNTIAFNQLENPEKQFPGIRVWGTVGWIVAGLTISLVLSRLFSGVEVEQSNIPIKMAAIASAFLGLYSFTLPHTPPKNVGRDVSIGDILGLKAIKLMKNSSFLVFVIASLLISIPLAFYYSFTNMFLNDIGMTDAAAKQTMGQMSEVIFMVLIPWFFVRLGVKRMLILGMASWVIRYALFSMGDIGGTVWMLYLGILLHGICYDFFFVSGQIYMDKKADESIRASAQGFITLVTYGVGIGIGSIVSGNVVDMYTSNGEKNWETIWWIPAVFSLIVMVFFALTFKDRLNRKSSVDTISMEKENN
jgi:nucleoside transporter